MPISCRPRKPMRTTIEFIFGQRNDIYNKKKKQNQKKRRAANCSVRMVLVLRRFGRHIRAHRSLLSLINLASIENLHVAKSTISWCRYCCCFCCQPASQPASLPACLPSATGCISLYTSAFRIYYMYNIQVKNASLAKQ